MRHYRHWAELRNKGIVKHIGIINLNLRHFETENGAPGWHPTPEALKRVIRKAIDYSKSKGVSIEQLAMSFSTANPRIATTLFSSTNPENVLKSIRCTNTPLNMELFTEMQMILEPGFRDTWVNS
jgi:diketogulonate reductase-like aldo/keto reductase